MIALSSLNIICCWNFIWRAFLVVFGNKPVLDPDGDGWGADGYSGDWTVCDQSGNGYCLPNGENCYDGMTTADKCPLNYGGSGDGCQPPNLITTLINIALQPGNVDEPMFYGQAGLQNILLLCAFGSVPVLLLFWSCLPLYFGCSRCQCLGARHFLLLCSHWSS